VFDKVIEHSPNGDIDPRSLRLAFNCMFDGESSARLKGILTEISTGKYKSSTRSFQSVIAGIVGESAGALSETAACEIFHGAQKAFIESMHVFFIPENTGEHGTMPVLRTCPEEGKRAPNPPEETLQPHRDSDKWAKFLAVQVLASADVRNWFLQAFNDLAAVQDRFLVKLQQVLAPVLPEGYVLRVVDANQVFNVTAESYRDERFTYFVPDDTSRKAGPAETRQITGEKAGDLAIFHGYHNLRPSPTDQLSDM